MNVSRASLKRSFLYSIVGSLVAAAFMGIFVLLKGGFDDIDAKVLATTTVFGVFSVTSLGSLRSIESDKAALRVFSWAGILLSAGAFAAFAIVIWRADIFESEGLLKTAFSLGVLAVSWAHAALLIPFRSQGSRLNLIVTATLGFIAVVAAMVLNLILFYFFEDSDFYFRLLGVFAILDVLGTIVSPILAKFTPKPVPADPLPLI